VYDGAFSDRTSHWLTLAVVTAFIASCWALFGWCFYAKGVADESTRRDREARHQTPSCPTDWPQPDRHRFRPLPEGLR